MDAHNIAALVIPLLVTAVLWTLLRHWILPFVLGFALAVALGPSARPMLATSWEAIARVGDSIFGTSSRGRDEFEAPERYQDRREPGTARSYE